MVIQDLFRICRRSILPVLALGMISGPVTSSAASTPDLLYYFNLALKNDPQFRSVEFESLAARETLRQAYAGLLPKISADLSYTKTFQEVNSSKNKVYATGSTDYETQNYGATLVQPLFRYASFVSIEQGKTVQSRSELEQEKARQDLVLRVAEAYMEVLLVKEKLAAVKAEEAAVDLQSVQARERAEKGMAPITDRYDTEARLATVQAQRVETENSLTDALQMLTEICGVPADDVAPLKEDIPLKPPFPENIAGWTEAGMKQNLELLILKLKAESASKEIERQKAAHYPTLDFQFDLANTDTKGSLFGGGSNTTTYDLIFKLNIPIYEGGVIASRTREAFNIHQSALQGVTRQSRQAERKVRSTYNGVVSAITRIMAMKKSIEAQKLVVEAKEEGFRAGLYISLAVLDAAQDLYRYRKEHAQALNDYILNSFRLKHAVGTLKPEELNLLNDWLQN